MTPSVRLLEPLGEGGMGTVWLADHLTLHTRVVVKVLRSDWLDEEDSVARFSDEATAAAQVRSPHVVQMLDHGITEEGIPFIVMELLEGRDLFTHVQERGPLPVGEVVTIVTQVAKALERVHELGMVHRDIKPENIFVCTVGSGEPLVKLLDFGIAKSPERRMTHATQAGLLLGTPCYMSPEAIVGGHAVDAYADLWGLAVVAFEALTGHDAFPGDSIAAVALKLHEPHRPVPSERARATPPALDRWFERAFALDREARFSTARAMADALVQAHASVASTPAVTVPSKRNHRAFLVRGAALLAIGLLGLLVSSARPRVQSPLDSTFAVSRLPARSAVRPPAPSGGQVPEQQVPRISPATAAGSGHPEPVPSSASPWPPSRSAHSHKRL